MNDGFDAALDAALDAYAFEHAHDPYDDGLDDRAVDSSLLRIDRIEDVELPAARDGEARERLFAELNSLYDDVCTVDDWRGGESIEERNARIRERDAEVRQADRPAGGEADPVPLEWEWAKERDREAGRLSAPGSLGADAAAVRRFVRAQLERAGADVDAHLRRPARGKPTAAAIGVRSTLAPIVADASARGATLEALAAATNRTVSAVFELRREGRNA